MSTFGKFWLKWKAIKYKASSLSRIQGLRSEIMQKLNVKRILAPPEYDVPFQGVQDSVEKFVSALSKHLQAELLRTSIEELWASHRPSPNTEPFFSYFRKVCSHMILAKENLLIIACRLS
jgi:hypothetical protein